MVTKKRGPTRSMSEVSLAALGQAYESLLSRTEVRGACVVFTGHTNNHGYGMVSAGNYPRLAHRIMWVYHHGPTKLNVLHHCDNPACVNIDHLWVGTQKDNGVDMAQKGRSARGKKHAMAILGSTEVRAIRCQCEAGKRQRTIAAEFGVAEQTVSSIKHGKTWRWLD